jgi:hypothetical protein
LLDGQFKRDARAQGRLFKQERQRLAAQRRTVKFGRALDVGGEIEQKAEFFGGCVEIAVKSEWVRRWTRGNMAVMNVYSTPMNI